MPKRQGQQGFTLFELMLVVLIIALVSSAVVVTVGRGSNPEKQVQESGQRLFEQMEFALDEALVQQRLVGFRIDPDDLANYTWHYYDDTRWPELENSLTPIALPEDVALEIQIDDELLENLLENTLNNLTDEDELPPHIVFYPSGDVSSFQLQLVAKETEQSFRIYLDERGALTHSGIDKQQGDR